MERRPRQLIGEFSSPFHCVLSATAEMPQLLQMSKWQLAQIGLVADAAEGPRKISERISDCRRVWLSMQSANLPAGRVTAQAPTEAGGGGAAPICRRVSGRTLLLSSHAGHRSAGILPTEMIGLRWGSKQKGAAAPNGLVIGLLECRPPFHWWSLTAFAQSHTHWTRLTDHGGCAGRDTAWWSPRPRHRGGAGSWGLGSIAAVGSAC